MIPCPRRAETFISITQPSDDKFDPCCNYCGSMNPDRFMELLEAKQLTLGSTDKNYKVYVTDRPGSQLLHAREIKFYFQHLSEAQKRRFVELYNKDIGKGETFVFAGNFSFYTFPFFMQKVS